MTDYSHPGEIPVTGGIQQYPDAQYSQAYYQQQQPPREKSHEEKLQEKARKWQQLQNKRYGEKRKFGMCFE